MDTGEVEDGELVFSGGVWAWLPFRMTKLARETE